MTNLAEVARITDEVTARARAELVRAIRQAAAEGMTARSELTTGTLDPSPVG